MGAIEKIREQQEKLAQGRAAWVVGEQLAEICAAEPESERLVDADLAAAGMGLADCEKKIKAWADGHRTGGFAYVSPQKAEEIIREFYGLPKRESAGRGAAGPSQSPPFGAATAPPEGEPRARTVNLLDFL